MLRRAIFPARPSLSSGLARASPSLGVSSTEFRGYSSSNAKLRPKTRIGVFFTRFHDKPGIASDVLAVLKKYNLQLTHLESKLYNYSFDGATIEFDIDGVVGTNPRIEEALKHIRSLGVQAEVRPPIPVPWFPSTRKEIDLCVEDVIGAGAGGLVDQDHPGFNDKEYMKRREEITRIANGYREGDGRIPRLEYTAEEVRVWKAVYEKLEGCHARWACEEFNEVLPELKAEAGYGPNQIPQLNDISEYLSSKTGFRLRPVCGLLSARDFLNALAFRTFCSTQYIRHGGNPFYTPEPDVCHELIGHVPLLADPHFAEFTQKVGLASLGASDEAIARLASIYWFTVEFGLVRSTMKPTDPDDTGVRVMGAGILSSFGEMEWSAARRPSDECREMGSIARDYPDMRNPIIEKFDPKVAAEKPYPITTYQPTYFIGESLREMKELISDYCDTIDRPFHPVYDPITGIVNPSRHVERLDRTSTAADQAEKQKAYFASLKP
mmetsp:Transcript_170909/g.547764  ORF Transcript_170909/g.547764 Transcript_170909/m.547764 type:complete len:494 (-) Transcript_170909:175-1656(-)